ncbi:MAG: hypothetical protein GXO63_00320, partial [Candidatus Micrarchaeota archaeon]|nr:hypothetical protein [Candidatus Micrarchaeota archaeon]
MERSRVAEFRDSEIYGTKKIMLDVNSGWLVFVNTTTPAVEARTGSFAEKYWYADIFTKDSAGNPIPSAAVTAFDIGGIRRFSGLTDSNGHARTALVSVNITSSGTVEFYPYTFRAEKTGYTFQDKTVNITGNEVITLFTTTTGCSYTGGNWIISKTDSCYLKNQKIVLSGNLTVHGRLVLDNVVMVFPSTVDGEYGINVTGEFKAVHSNLSSSGAAWFFYVDNSAKFNMTSSVLEGVGWKPRSGSLPDGIRFKANHSYFVNNTVHAQIVFENAYHSYIAGNSFFVPAEGIAGAAALRLEKLENATVRDNFVNISAFKGYGIFFKYVKNSKFINNTVYTYGEGTTPGFFGEFSEFNKFRDNSVFSAKFQSYWFRSETRNLDIDTSNLAEGKKFYYFDSLSGIVVENISDAGQIYLNFVKNATLRNIYMVGADNVYIEFSDDIKLYNVTVLNSSSDNLGLKASTNVYIEDYRGENQVSVSTGGRKVNLGIDLGSKNITVRNCRLVSGPGSTLSMRIRGTHNALIENCKIYHGDSNVYPNTVELKEKGTKDENITFKDT